jgi:hypothetical protein
MDGSLLAGTHDSKTSGASSFKPRENGIGWHALRLCEGRGDSVIRHTLRRASEPATRKLKLDAPLATFVLLASRVEIRVQATRLF